MMSLSSNAIMMMSLSSNATPSPSPVARKKQRAAEALSQSSSSPSSALTVFTNRALLQLITQFQRGVPLLIHELVKAYVASGMQLPMSGMNDISVSVIDSAVHEVGRYWASAMRLGDLAAVQVVCRMRQWPELHGISGMRMRDLPKYATICGRLDVLQWLHAQDEIEPSPWCGDIVVTAIAYKHDQVVRWLLANRYDACRGDISSGLAIVAERGDLLLLRELVAFRAEALTPKVMDEALRHAQWEVIRYLHEHSPAGCSTKGMDLAAWEGHLDVVQFLHENRSEGCTAQAMDGAAFCGHLHVVKFLREQRAEGCTVKAFTRAARAGQVDIVKYLHENCGMDAPDRLIEKVLTYGNLDTILRFHADAAKAGHKTRGVEVPERFTDKVLKEGKLAVVRYLHEVMNQPIRAESLETTKEFQNEALMAYVASRVKTSATDGVGDFSKG